MIQYWILMILIFDCLHLASMWLLDLSYFILSHLFHYLSLIIFFWFFLYLSMRLYLDSSFLWAWKTKVLLTSIVICYLLIHWFSYYLLTNFTLPLTHTVISSLLFSFLLFLSLLLSSLPFSSLFSSSPLFRSHLSTFTFP